MKFIVRGGVIITPICSRKSNYLLPKKGRLITGTSSKHHSNTADLLHDILCMSNNRADRDAYIIFGVVDKTADLIGVGNDIDHRDQQNVINQLKDKKFVGGIRPRL